MNPARAKHLRSGRRGLLCCTDVSLCRVLLQVWMRRQHLSGQPDGFNGFLMSMLSAQLMQQSRLVRTSHLLVLQKLPQLQHHRLYGSPALAACLYRVRSTLHCRPGLWQMLSACCHESRAVVQCCQEGVGFCCLLVGCESSAVGDQMGKYQL